MRLKCRDWHTGTTNDWVSLYLKRRGLRSVALLEEGPLPRVQADRRRNLLRRRAKALLGPEGIVCAAGASDVAPTSDSSERSSSSELAPRGLLDGAPASVVRASVARRYRSPACEGNAGARVDAR